MFDARLKAGVRNGETGTPAASPQAWPARNGALLLAIANSSRCSTGLQSIAALPRMYWKRRGSMTNQRGRDMTEATQPDAKKPAQPTPSSQTPDPKTSNEDAKLQKRAKAHAEKATNEDG